MAENNVIFLDCETIPSQQAGIKEQLLSELKCPGNITKESSVATWWTTKAKVATDEMYLKTSLSGTTGELISLAWAFNQKDIQCTGRTLEEPESKILKTFFSALEEANTDYIKFCAHNAKFDMKFLWQRSVVLGIRPPIAIHTGRHPDIIDTMELWAGYNEYISFDVLCHALGFPGKTGMSGVDVWPAVQAGEYDKIREYNMDDIKQLRQCYRKMTFADWTPDDPVDETVKATADDAKLEESNFFDPVMKEI